MSTVNTNSAFQATAMKKLDEMQRLLDPRGLALEADQAKAKAKAAEEVSLRGQEGVNLCKASAFQAAAMKKLDEIQRLLDPRGLALEDDQAKVKAAEEVSLRRQEGVNRRKAEAEARDLRRKMEDLERQLAAKTANDE